MTKHANLQHNCTADLFDLLGQSGYTLVRVHQLIKHWVAIIKDGKPLPKE
ncbi:hypothetical protein PtA15_8A459 [Puccinia triticina]|uniref:Uncharacterized protein n=1 Tax=Puccinia triticina TaxID=208348 RepID=A0ABY7CS80_9BASI|nr:uncharacterized protein PtA15_8A459 [Puccinia triticina]WAQ87555.1 hypothetical protein PtA15_8A459 [Puccinia triticina]